MKTVIVARLRDAAEPMDWFTWRAPGLATRAFELTDAIAAPEGAPTTQGWWAVRRRGARRWGLTNRRPR